MMRIQVLFLLASLFATTLALRGESLYSIHRLVREGAVERRAVDHAATNEKKTKSSKAPKSSEKSKSSKADKKCKKAKGWNPVKSTPETTDLAQDGSQVTEVEEEMPYCLQAAMSAEECAALNKGDLPKDDHNVEGKINMEIEFDRDTSPNQVKRTLGDILRTETPSKFVGCEKRRLRSLASDGKETDSNESYLSVTGVDFQQLEFSTKGEILTSV